MSQVSKLPVKEEIYKNIFELFLTLFTKTFTHSHAENLLNELFTPTEKIVIAKRLGIAVLLKKGYNYNTIQQVLRVSKPTIAFINNQFKYQKNGLNYFTEEVIKDQKLSEYLDTIINNVLKGFSMTKGSGVWKYLRTEIEQNKSLTKKSKIV